MPREVRPIARNPQHVDGPIRLAANPERNGTPCTTLDMRHARTRVDLIALSRSGNGRPASSVVENPRSLGPA